MSKKIWIATGIVATAVGVTALVAHAERGGRDGHGFGGHRGGWEDGERGHRGWRREMTKEEYDTETRSKFASWDANSDGVVDNSEAESAVSKRMEKMHSRRGGRGMMRHLGRFDTDNDGKVTLAEVQAKVAERFQRMDLDGDGKITDADLPPMMRGRNFLAGGEADMDGHGKHHGGRRGARMVRYLSGADTNKDGAVTLAELQERAAKRFARFDHNNDGVIDQADHDVMHKAMTEYMVKRFMHRFGATDAKLTLEQFTKYRAARSAKRDADGDGVMDNREDRGRGGHHGWQNDDRRDDDRGGPSDRNDGEGDPRAPEKRDTR